MAPGGCAPVRLFVGGVDASVSVAELAGRFASFGAVAGVEEAPCKLPGGGVDKRARNFFLNLAPNTDKELQRCLATVRPTAQSASVLTPPPQYNGCVWRGSRLHIGRASEHFTARLKREWSAAAAARAAEAAAAAVKAASAAQLLSPLALSTARRELEERLQATKLRLRAGNEFLTVNACGGPGRHKRSFQRLPPGTLVKSAGEVAVSQAERPEPRRAPPKLTAALLRAAVEPVPLAAAAPAPRLEPAKPAEADPWARLFRKAAGVEALSDVSDAELEPEPEPEPEAKPEPEPVPKRQRVAVAPAVPQPAPAPARPSAAAAAPPSVAAPPVELKRERKPEAPYGEQASDAKLRLERQQQVELLQRLGLTHPEQDDADDQPQSIADGAAAAEERHQGAMAVQAVSAQEEGGEEEEESEELAEVEEDATAEEEEGEVEEEPAKLPLAADAAAWERVLRMAAGDAEPPPSLMGVDVDAFANSRKMQEHGAAPSVSPAAAPPMTASRRARVELALARTREGEGLAGIYYADGAFDWRSLAVRASEQTWSLLGDAPEPAAAVAGVVAPVAAAPSPDAALAATSMLAARPARRAAPPPPVVDLGALSAAFTCPAASLEAGWQANRDALLDDAKRKRRQVGKEMAAKSGARLAGKRR